MMHTPPPDDCHSAASAAKEASPHRLPPQKPRPSEDKAILPPSQAPKDEPDSIPSDPAAIDILTLSPLAAQKLLTAAVEDLIRKSSQAPPTPPSSNPNTPRLTGIAIPERPSDHASNAQATNASPTEPCSPNAHHHHDVPHPHKTPIGSPEAHPTESPHVPGPGHGFYIDHPGADAANARQEEEAERAQYKALARKFYSKAPPPITLEGYLKRLHTYCPMSVGVYLAAGWYIQRLAGGIASPSPSPSAEGSPSHSPEGSRSASPKFSRRGSVSPLLIPVTPKTAHRLLLAALRVATKVLEDRMFPHARVAKVGGVSERELSRLEVSLAFLLDFELRARKEDLDAVARRMGRVWARGGADDEGD